MKELKYTNILAAKNRFKENTYSLLSSSQHDWNMDLKCSHLRNIHNTQTNYIYSQLSGPILDDRLKEKVLKP